MKNKQINIVFNEDSRTAPLLFAIVLQVSGTQLKGWKTVLPKDIISFSECSLNTSVQNVPQMFYWVEII